jgi:hypothetical protein
MGRNLPDDTPDVMATTWGDSVGILVADLEAKEAAEVEALALAAGPVTDRDTGREKAREVGLETSWFCSRGKGREESLDCETDEDDVWCAGRGGIGGPRGILAEAGLDWVERGCNICMPEPSREPGALTGLSAPRKGE